MLFEIKDASFSYGQTSILRDINAKLDFGEILCVLGQNGAGKTTFLRCCLNLLRWNKGASYLQGKDVRTLPSKELFSTIAYVPQAKNAAFSFSVMDMILFGLASKFSFYEAPKEEDEALAMEALRDLRIEHLAYKNCNQISGGELQMVLIARALVSKPKMLVLDEPESNLDLKNQVQILRLLEVLKKLKISAVINTHYIENALLLADRVLLLGRDLPALFGENSGLNEEGSVINEEVLQRYFGVEIKLFEKELLGKNYAFARAL